MTTFPLTTGVDNDSGGAGADVFSGPGGGVDTLNGNGGNDEFDIDGNQIGTIDGGAGIDSIVMQAGENVLNSALSISNVENFVVNNQNINATVAQLDEFSSITTTTMGPGFFIFLNGAGGTLDLSTRFQSPKTLQVEAEMDTSAVNIIGGGEDDFFIGSNFGGTLTGGGGNDTLDGGSGNDVLDGGLGNDQLDGSTGVNTASFASVAAAVNVNLAAGTATGQGSDTLANIQNVIGSSLADTITGNGSDNVLNGGAGADIMTGGDGNDAYIVDNAGDQVIEGAGGGTDRVHASISYTLTANVENLILDGTANINGTGNTLNNSIMGNAGNNILNGGAGADLMTGGAGDDAYIVDNAGDQVVEAAGGGTDRVHSTVNYTLTANVENLILDGTANINGTGNTLANSIIGNSGNNVLTGGAGADQFVYSGTPFGKDTLADFTVAGASHDVIALAHTLFADFNTVLADSAQVGTSTVITHDPSDTITLANTQRSTLTSSDFHFT